MECLVAIMIVLMLIAFTSTLWTVMDRPDKNVYPFEKKTKEKHVVKPAWKKFTNCLLKCCCKAECCKDNCCKNNCCKDKDKKEKFY